VAVQATSFSRVERIHARALEASERYKKVVADLVEILQEVEERRVFQAQGHSSLFRYATDSLGLGDNTAYDLIQVARKAREVPALQGCLREGRLPLTRARRVCSVLTKGNQAEWLEKACTLSNRRLEKEIARVRPGERTPERATYVTADWVRLELGMSERDMLKLRRVQDLVCQSQRRAVSLEQTISALASEYLSRHDPLEKAKRAQVKRGMLGTGQQAPTQLGTGQQAPTQLGMGQQAPAQLGTGQQAPLQLGTGQKTPSERTPIPAHIAHAVHLRDQRRCTETLPSGHRCNEGRWIDIHHIQPISQGGTHELANLITLCSAHHKRRPMRGC
jgi:hypothetical protein